MHRKDQKISRPESLIYCFPSAVELANRKLRRLDVFHWSK